MSIFLVNGKPVFINGPKILPRTRFFLFIFFAVVPFNEISPIYRDLFLLLYHLLSGRGDLRGLNSVALRQKKLQNLRLAASKVMILWLRHHQDSQCAFYIDIKL